MSVIPRYERIAQTLNALIERGVLRPGDRVPSLRDNGLDCTKEKPISVPTARD
jgi:DNA-binding transcriptional regulator YhcF (GntR family)